MAQSPLFFADKIKAPLLVVQGANDPRVKKAESEQIVVALRELGREVEYMLASDEGHGFAGRENRLAVATAMEQFFALYLSGRRQDDIPSDIAARLAALTVDVNTVKLPTNSVAAIVAETAPLPAASGSVITAGTSRYNTKLEVQGQQLSIETVRTIEASSANGRRAWRVIEHSTLPMGTVADTLELDKRSLIPLNRRMGGMGLLRLSYSSTAVTGEIGMPGQTTAIDVKLKAPVFADGSGLEISLAGLPLLPGYETTLRTFDPEMQRVRKFKLTVSGREKVKCAAGTFDSFVVQLLPLDDEESGTSTLHVMKDAPHHVVRREFRLPASMGGGTGLKELAAFGADATG
jgi:hypothetical protein